MHGIALPKGQVGEIHRDGVLARLGGVLRANRAFFVIVILPTLLVAVYYALFASNQYEASADFVVRHSDKVADGGGLGQVLGFSLGGGATSDEAYIVQQYLLSHDAVAQLQAKDNLVALFRRPGVDWVSRLRFADPTPERLLDYYRGKVAVKQDDMSGISHLTVHAFRPEDAYRIASQLLQMGEAQINAINERTYHDNIASARHDLELARQQLDGIQAKLTSYRRGNDDVDPENTGKAQINLVTGLTATLVDARARLQAMRGVVSPASPQYQAMARQVQALETQVAAQSSKIAGPDHSVANRLSDYEQLLIQREEVAKVYAEAAVRYEGTQAEARRKQLYLIRVVEPNMPVKSEYPKRWEMVVLVFFGLFCAYAIGWLLWAGVKEHSL